MIHTSNLPTQYLNLDVHESVKPLHPKETEIQKLFGESVLTLDVADPRPKMLYLMTEADPLNSFPIKDYHRTIKEILDLEQAFIEHKAGDPVTKEHLTSLKNMHNQALNGNEEVALQLKQIEQDLNSNNKGIDQYFKKLDEDFDVRFKIIHSNEELCQEIAHVSKVDNFKSLIINGHGDSTGLQISPSEFLIHSQLLPGKLLSSTGNKLNYILDDTCFSSLPKDSEIILLSCSAGESETNIASTISKLSQRHVFASPLPISSDGIEFSSSMPPVPIFAHKTLFGRSITPTCKFSPDGSKDCFSSDYSSLTMMALSSLIAVYCAYKYFKSN